MIAVLLYAWLGDLAHELPTYVFKIYWPMTEGDKLSSKMKGKNTANQHPSEKETATVDWL